MNVKIIKTESGPYNPNNFVGSIRVIANVYGVEFNFISRKVYRDLQIDLECYGIYKSNDDIENMMKEEALEWYHDNIKLIRKEKLMKLNEYN